MSGNRMSGYRGRFAPSPTGRLHLGSLLAALGSWLRARAAHGAWLVRIEDIDPPREVPGSAESILRTLRACGLEPDEPPLYQDTRLEAYESAFEKLKELRAVFPCWCSRSDLAALGSVHRGGCIARPDPHRAPAWRVRVDDARIEFDDGLQGRQRWKLAEGGDFVIRRADGPFAYQLACAVDDAAQGISEVVRGADLLDSTPRQIFLLRMLGLREPAYLHLPVLLDAGGAKLSKSEGAAAIDADDPLPALRTALRLLGVPGPALGASEPESLLHDASDVFDPRMLPRVQSMVACKQAPAKADRQEPGLPATSPE
ncbi:MAG TPA: tRNA glutamyl-Q(34) synthetase GluQRS [Rhodanobacteraceae bacterium]|nr:tRNA glutamyl-Q(34) synthetase GluQRS [Rhodanobacteraceae bacterium]